MREELDVGGRRRARTQLVELGLPEVALVWLVPDDQVFDRRVALDEVRRICAIVVPGRLVEWRGVGPTVKGHDEPFGSSRPRHRVQLGDHVRRQRPCSRFPRNRDPESRDPELAGDREGGVGLEFERVLRQADEELMFGRRPLRRNFAHGRAAGEESGGSEEKDETPGHVSSTLGSLAYEVRGQPSGTGALAERAERLEATRKPAVGDLRPGRLGPGEREDPERAIIRFVEM